MELILLKDTRSLGKVGDLVNVKPGYARNYLLPTKRAVRATQDNKVEFERRKAEFEVEHEQRLVIANEIKESLANLQINIVRQAAEDGKLYGSVSARDILADLQAINPNIERDNIMLNEPIKYLGIFDITISLTPEIKENIKLSISRKQKFE